MEAAKDDEDFKKNSPEAIMKREKARARVAELEFNTKRTSRNTNSATQESLMKNELKRKRGSTFCGNNYMPDVDVTTTFLGRKKFARTNLRSTTQQRSPAERYDTTSLSASSDSLQFGEKSSDAPVAAQFDSLETKKAYAQLAATCLEFPETGKEDVARLRDARARFASSNQPKSDGKSGWSCPRLKTSLFSHQVIGCGFMIRREKSEQEPLGGLFFDAMGLGKTIQMLSCIVDQKTTQGALNRNTGTTLIVLPPGLIAHWKEEIKKHCDSRIIKRVLEYKSKNMVGIMEPEKIIGKHDIVYVKA